MSECEQPQRKLWMPSTVIRPRNHRREELPLPRPSRRVMDPRLINKEEEEEEDMEVVVAERLEAIVWKVLETPCSKTLEWIPNKVWAA
jgi:hypothetical protein